MDSNCDSFNYVINRAIDCKLVPLYRKLDREVNGLAVDPMTGHLYGAFNGYVFLCKAAQNEPLNFTTLLTDKDSTFYGIAVTRDER